MAGVEIKRKDLSTEEKLSIIESYDKLPKMSQQCVPVVLKISQPLLCKLLKYRDSILKAAKENKNFNWKQNCGGKDCEVESVIVLVVHIWINTVIMFDFNFRELLSIG